MTQDELIKAYMSCTPEVQNALTLILKRDVFDQKGVNQILKECNVDPDTIAQFNELLEAQANK